MGRIEVSGQISRPETIERLVHSAHGAFAMLAGLKLDLFTPLMSGPMTVEQVSDALGIGVTKLRPLLYSLVLAGLLTVENARFSNTEETNHFLAAESPAYMGARQGTWSIFWDAALKTAESVRSGVPQAMHDWSDSPEESERWLRGIHGNSLAAGRDLAARHDFSSGQRLLDVAGGSGGLSLAVTEAWPDVEATVIELPAVAPITQRLVEEVSAGDRVQVVAADAVNDLLPGSYDVAVMQRLIQVLSPSDASRVLRNVSSVVNSGGFIYIYGAILEDSRLAPYDEVIQTNITLINTTEGQAYTEQEYRTWLAEANFEQAELTRPAFGNACMCARKR